MTAIPTKVVKKRANTSSKLRFLVASLPAGGFSMECTGLKELGALLKVIAKNGQPVSVAIPPVLKGGD